MAYKFVLAPDSFKESMSAKEVCIAMEKGIKKVFPDAELVQVPMADGGEGTVESLVDATDGKIIEMEVQGPLKDQTVVAKFSIP
ncbi:glycerate kinase [Treponema phagedenis]|uniref:glycerate kinase n=1 Tax=Treponema phagedenis TaxID=162 RepID=UPI001C073D38|nr:glycerate kinase [Treponema phagedenis]